jgi:aspartyl-tRNA(Asn)/glutamyl-tRNA(Gln) amidotransferase subunit C
VKITETEVRYVADLANLKLADSEIARLAKDMDEILTHMDAMSELDTSTVEPMAQVLYQDAAYEADDTATLRDDEVRPPLGNLPALANAPLAGSGYYKVPKVIER